ncbi:hypothetical protein D3C87_2121260 [compost metagenome]
MAAMQQADQLPHRLTAAEGHAIFAGDGQRFDDAGTGIHQLLLQLVVAVHYKEGAEQQTDQ